MIRLFDLNPALDKAELARSFQKNGRLQIRQLLTDESARNLAKVLSEQTPWGIAQSSRGSEVGVRIPREALARMPREELVSRQRELHEAVGSGQYAFLYSQFPLLEAYRDRPHADGPHQAVLELINDQPFMDLIREVTGMRDLVKADAQATLFGPGQFLAMHDDSQVSEGRRVAYVLNFCSVDWRPDWGGYLNFYDEDGDVLAGYRPRFNALNIFAVPQAHNVTYVPPFAPVARYAITGWFRDR